MSTILDKILEKKREEIAEAKVRVPLGALQAIARDLPATFDFEQALRTGPGVVRLIAEVKKASPSAGIIREDFHPVEIARAYGDSGASCISVLTDEPFFRGHLDFLQKIRAAVQIPLLRKDFIIDPYQLVEARVAGADCVLLIAECLSPAALKEFHEHAAELGLATLIELHEAVNLQAVLDTGTSMIGVNNRDLRTFKTDLEHTINMRRLIPADRMVIGESGIQTHGDVQRMAAAGVEAMLVGETLMRHPSIELAVKELLFGRDTN